ncbi:MAG: DJ-1/PfpI family protein [Pseudohongiella sp.]|nr:DJ-1/PfpI family protein [Pseudohongiella sp.]MDO9519282.1 DJ-1/PfpI family protein [Pseudohongiella sp.]
MSMRIGIFLFEDIEALDFAGPYEVFTTASRVAQKSGMVAPFAVFSVSASGHAVRVRAGMKVIPDFTFEDTPAIDVLIVPGGVVTAEMQNRVVVDWIKDTSSNAKLIASVCTGVFLLAKAGVVTNQKVTTHWEDIADLRRQFPDLTVRENVRWVDEGQIVTSAGISAGIDMSLHLVERLAGKALAIATARQMEFDWHEN